MRKIGCWGGHLELKAAASIFQTFIYIASDSLVPGQGKWTLLPFQIHPCLMDPSISMSKIKGHGLNSLTLVPVIMMEFYLYDKLWSHQMEDN